MRIDWWVFINYGFHFRLSGVVCCLKSFVQNSNQTSENAPGTNTHFICIVVFIVCAVWVSLPQRFTSFIFRGMEWRWYTQMGTTMTMHKHSIFFPHTHAFNIPLPGRIQVKSFKFLSLKFFLFMTHKKNFADNFHHFKWVIVFGYDTTYFHSKTFIFAAWVLLFYPLKMSLKDSH